MTAPAPDAADNHGLSHFDSAGKARMVDVGAKAPSDRIAVATGCIRMMATTLTAIRTGEHAKGDVLGIARIAAIMAAKRTADLVPLCHPLPLTRVEVDFQLLSGDQPQVRCQATVATHDRTGVEMEALCAVQIGLLTIYDMCKAVDRGMIMTDIQLLEKTGGRSGHWRRSQNGGEAMSE